MAKEAEPGTGYWWIQVLVVPFVIGLIVVLTAGRLESTVSERDRQFAKDRQDAQIASVYVSYAIEILARPIPADGELPEDVRQLRTWAVDVMEAFSEVKLDPEAREAVIDGRIVIPTVTVSVATPSEGYESPFATVESTPPQRDPIDE